jgi:hypothetical protein
MNTGYKIVEQGEIRFLTFQIVKWAPENHAEIMPGCLVF